MPSKLRRSIIFVLLGSFILLNGIAYIVLKSRSPEIGWGREEPEIPSYPQALNEKRQKINVYGHQTYSFEVTNDYPSTTVLDYYSGVLEAQGYRPVREDYKPAWSPEKTRGDTRTHVISQFWVDPEGLRVLQLDIKAREKIERDPDSERIIDTQMLPGERVEINLSRKVFLPGGAPTEPTE